VDDDDDASGAMVRIPDGVISVEGYYVIANTKGDWAFGSEADDPVHFRQPGRRAAVG
jgi:hypothetical protein